MPSNQLILSFLLLPPSIFPRIRIFFFPMSRFFSSGDQSIGALASVSVLPMNSHDWFPLGLTGWISLQSKGLSRVFNTTVQKCSAFFMVQLSHPYMTTWKIITLMIWTFVNKVIEKAMAPHSSTLAWKIPWMEEPGRLQSMGLLRVRHDWATSLSFFTFMHWRRKWKPTPVFLPGESQGQRSLVGCRLWGHKELDTTEAT